MDQDRLAVLQDRLTELKLLARIAGLEAQVKHQRKTAKIPAGGFKRCQGCGERTFKEWRECHKCRALIGQFA